MKESEAKDKWCPHVRMNCANSDSQTQHNTNPSYRCIASDCMMWESWEYEKLGGGTIGKEPKITMHKGEGDCGLKTKELNCNGS